MSISHLMPYKYVIFFQRACMCDEEEIAHLMVTKGRADPQDRQRDTGTVALHEAAARGHIHCVQVCSSKLDALNSYMTIFMQ